MLEKGKIPVTEIIVLESTNDQWSLLRNRLVSEIKFSGIVKLNEQKKIRLNLLIVKVLHSDDIKGKNTCMVETNFLDKDATLGLVKLMEFFLDYLDNACWTFFGFIISNDKNIPIVIRYYEKIDLAIYAMKTKDQTVKNFFPASIPADPSLN